MDQESRGLREWLAKEKGSCTHLVGQFYSLCKRMEQAFVSPFYRWQDGGIKRFALVTELGQEPRSPGCMVHSPQTGSLFFPVTPPLPLILHFTFY